MSFSHPSQRSHKIAGMRKALTSARTPSHLIPHIQNRLNQEASMKQRGLPSTPVVTGGMVSPKQMNVDAMGTPGDPAQQTTEPRMPAKFGKGAKRGFNAGKLKVQGKKPAKRNALLGVFPAAGGSGPDDDGY